MKKMIVILLLVISTSFIVVLALGNYYDFLPGITSQSPSLPNTPRIPESTHVPPSTTVSFDFDTGSPTLFEGHNTPFNQTSGGVAAFFSSPSDPAAFSIQSYETTFYTLSQFSGNYLFDNKIVRDTLELSFSQPISTITLTFATVEFYGAGHVDEPSFMKLTAYKDTLGSLVGSATAQGTVSNNIYPQGTLSFTGDGQSFNLIRIEMLFQQPGGTDYLIDNITVTTA